MLHVRCAWGSTNWGVRMVPSCYWGLRERQGEWVVWEWFVFVVWSDWCVQRLRLAAVRVTHTWHVELENDGGRRRCRYCIFGVWNADGPGGQ